MQNFQNKTISKTSEMQQNEDCAIVSRQNGESSAYERLLGMKRPSSSAMANLVEP
jgi:hypothetical protein